MQTRLLEDVVHAVARIPIRQDCWTNPHGRELLIEFLDNRDKYAQVREIDRCYNPSQAFFQFLYSHFFAGQRLAFVTVLTPHAPGSLSQSMLGAVEQVPGQPGGGGTLLDHAAAELQLPVG